MATFPSECRQRKDPYLAPFGGKGGEVSRIRLVYWGSGAFHSEVKRWARIKS
jgi:hypothetical protein